MRADIRPEATDEERAAILAALARALPAEPDPRGAWWRLGIREALDGGPRPSEPGPGR